MFPLYICSCLPPPLFLSLSLYFHNFLFLLFTGTCFHLKLPTVRNIASIGTKKEKNLVHFIPSKAHTYYYRWKCSWYDVVIVIYIYLMFKYTNDLTMKPYPGSVLIFVMEIIIENYVRYVSIFLSVSFFFFFSFILWLLPFEKCMFVLSFFLSFLLNV